MKIKFNIKESDVSFCQYKTFLRQKKIKKLGEGAYAFVYQHPTFSNVVVKVADMYADRLEDDPYLTYVKTAIRLKENTFVPKIYAVSVFEYYKQSRKSTIFECKKPEMFSITFMEKLYPLTHFKSAKFCKQAYKDNGICDIEDFEDHRYIISKNTKNRQLKTVLKELRKLFSKYAFDLHGDNVMWRISPELPYPQLVVTDPIT